MVNEKGHPVVVGTVGRLESWKEKATSPSNIPTVQLSVEAVLDQWQLDDEWWRQRISRRYVEVMIAGGKRMLLFEDLVTGEWFEQTP